MPVSGPHGAELSGRQALAEQIAEVERGASDQIRIEDALLTDNDLGLIETAAKAGRLANLRVLLLDGPNNALTDGAIAHLSGLANIEHLRLREATIGDAGLVNIASSLPKLRILNLPHAVFSDAGLDELRNLPDLEQLRFGSPHVTDQGITKLAEFPQLKRVHLIDVPITNAALLTFANMPKLESLYLDDVVLSDEAYEQLFRARPKLHVHLGQGHHYRDPHKDDHPH